MSRRCAAIGLAVIVLVLIAGCGSAQPTTTPVPQTDTLVSSTPTAVPPTATPGPTTAMLPPTGTPSGRQGEQPTLEATEASTPGPTGVSPVLSLGSEGLRVAIVFDNTAYDRSLRARWGFAAWLEYGDHIILFDTGGNGFLLMSNMEKLGLDPQEIEIIVLSHIHGDHTDGLQPLLDTGICPTVYVPASFPESFKDNVRAHTELVEVTEAVEILPGVHSTGELGMAIREQGLAVETPEGMVIITGCAHPGIIKMVRMAARTVEGEISLVVGGFHLGDLGESRIEKIIGDFRELGVKQVCPTHCTGETAIGMFAEEYGDDFVEGGVGRVIVVGTDH
jgi:7,8-dihydropterin-6-yl-methyl-4-(beta-D-ribofuranosyl)aminobenzene 5'-phosphate synthase